MNKMFTPKTGKPTDTLDSKLALPSVPNATRELDETYRPPSQLHIPFEAQTRFAEQGYDLHWVRVYNPDGSLDVKNIRKKEADGYTFVPKQEIPELNEGALSSFSTEIDKHGDLILIGELALARVPFARIQARRDYYQNIGKARNKAIVADLRTHSIGDRARGDVIKTERDQSTAPRREIDFSGDA